MVIISGFGLPGRFVAEVLDARKIPYCVIELNPSNAQSIAACEKRVVSGDSHPELLKQAGIVAAQILAITIPDEKIGLEVLQVARRLNPQIRGPIEMSLHVDWNPCRKRRERRPSSSKNRSSPSNSPS